MIAQATAADLTVPLTVFVPILVVFLTGMIAFLTWLVKRHVELTARHAEMMATQGVITQQLVWLKETDQTHHDRLTYLERRIPIDPVRA